MKKILRSVGKGIINGFPVIQSVILEIKKSKGITTPEVDPATGNPINKENKTISIIAEIATVGLIFAFVTKKITIDELLQLISLIGGN